MFHVSLDLLHFRFHSTINHHRSTHCARDKLILFLRWWVSQRLIIPAIFPSSFSAFEKHKQTHEQLPIKMRSIHSIKSNELWNFSQLSAATRLKSQLNRPIREFEGIVSNYNHCADNATVKIKVINKVLLMITDWVFLLEKSWQWWRLKLFFCVFVWN